METKSSNRNFVCPPSYFSGLPTFSYIYSPISKGGESKDQYEQDILTKSCKGLEIVSLYFYHCKADFYIPLTKPVQRKYTSDNI